MPTRNRNGYSASHRSPTAIAVSRIFHINPPSVTVII